MKCKKCSATVQETEKTCWSCGEPIEKADEGKTVLTCKDDNLPSNGEKYNDDNSKKQLFYGSKKKILKNFKYDLEEKKQKKEEINRKIKTTVAVLLGILIFSTITLIYSKGVLYLPCSNSDGPVGMTVIGVTGFAGDDVVFRSRYLGLKVTSINHNVFRKSSAKTVYIPDRLLNIYGKLVSPNLKEINVDENNPRYKSINGNLYSKDGKTLYQYACGKEDKQFVIPDSVTTINISVFEGCTSLENITIPETVTLIGDNAFYGCTSLTSVTIGNSVTSIGQDAFRDCTSLTNINYQGTMKEWEAISKGQDWDSNTGNYIVYCIDGTISK